MDDVRVRCSMMLDKMRMGVRALISATSACSRPRFTRALLLLLLLA
jgi:hypothetical protein